MKSQKGKYAPVTAISNERGLKLLSAIAAVGEDVAQPGEGGADGGQHAWRTIAILDVGRMYHGPDQKAECVGQDVPFAAFDL
jgi:hypothetical protein